MMKKKVTCIALALLLLCLTLTGCGGSSGATNAGDYAAGGSMSVTDDAFLDMKEESSTDFNSSMSQSAPQAKPEAEAPQETGSADGANAPDTPDTQDHSKLIYRANLDLETTSFDSVAQSLEGIVAGMGGYFEAQNVSNYGTYRNAYYVIRVPANNFNSLLNQVGELCLVRNQNKTSENVSEAYYDLEARLTTQRTKLERLQELLRQAENMEDIITIESAISDTELQIEYLTGSLRQYDSLINYSTVTINLQEVYKLSNVEEKPVSFIGRLSNALSSGLRNGIDDVEDFIIDLAYSWFSLLIFLAVLVVVVVVVRRVVKKRRQKKMIPPAPAPASEEPKDE